MIVLLTSLPHVVLQVLPERGDSYSIAFKMEARRLFETGLRGKTFRPPLVINKTWFVFSTSYLTTIGSGWGSATPDPINRSKGA